MIEESEFVVRERDFFLDYNLLPAVRFLPRLFFSQKNYRVQN